MSCKYCIDICTHVGNTIACFKLKAGRDRNQPIAAELIRQAKDNLIERRETHLDRLADKLREVPWERKLFQRTEIHGARVIQVWGM